MSSRLALALSPLILLSGFLPTPQAHADVTIQDRRGEGPLVLNQHEDYIVRNVRISGVTDQPALTLAGPIRSVTIENSKFGEIWSGPNRKAAAMEAVGASIGNFKVTDSAFYDAENQLVSLRDGNFGTVTFMHCTFKTSEAFLKKIYAANPWRTAPPTTEFYNIDRLELLDNEFSNTTIVIHPSVKTVVLRGDISKLLIESPDTQVIRLLPRADPPAAIPVLPTPTYAAALLEPSPPTSLPNSSPSRSAQQKK
jgi:hypothetical protein